MQSYTPRPIRFAGVATYGDWRIKRYRIRHPDTDFEETRFSEATSLVAAELPLPATTDMRPGVGFLIEHQGRGADYVVLGWWDRENELPLRVWLRTATEPAWRRAAGAESICVWDLQVIWHEREAYVGTLLGGKEHREATDRYLTRVDDLWTGPSKGQSTNS